MDLCTSQSLLWITFKLWGNRRSSQLSLVHNTGIAKDQEFSSPTCDENFWNVMLQIHRGQKWFLVSLPAFTKPWPMDLGKPCWSIQAMSTWHHIWRGVFFPLFFLWRGSRHFGEQTSPIQVSHLHSWFQNQNFCLLKKLSSLQWQPELHRSFWKGKTTLEAQSSCCSLSPIDRNLLRLPMELADDLGKNSRDQSPIILLR